MGQKAIFCQNVPYEGIKFLGHMRPPKKGEGSLSNKNGTAPGQTGTVP